MRLVRYLALCGVASRRASADVVRDGRVAVNGETTGDVSLDVTDADEVRVDGRPVVAPLQPATYILHKRAGQVCSRRDPHNPQTVLDDLPPEMRGRLKPVGRLDKDTTGLLLLSDDGDLAFRLTHPRYGVEKVYRALLDGPVSTSDVAALRAGIDLEDGRTAPARARVVKKDPRRPLLEIAIHEGRNRQIRRMFAALGRRTLSLERTAFGPLRLEGLPPGEARPLDAAELAALRRAVGLAPSDSAASTRKETGGGAAARPPRKPR